MNSFAGPDEHCDTEIVELACMEDSPGVQWKIAEALSKTNDGMKRVVDKVTEQAGAEEAQKAKETLEKITHIWHSEAFKISRRKKLQRT